MHPDENRAKRDAVGRTMIAQDARWISEAILPSGGVDAASSVLAMVLFGHCSRIVYEGYTALRDENRGLGVPELVSLLPDEGSDVMTQARHATKLLDDRKMPFPALIDSMRMFYAAHRAQFRDKVPRPLRLLECDLGLYSLQGRILSGTIPLQYRLGVSSSTRMQDMSHVTFDAAHKVGQIVAVLAAATGDTRQVAAQHQPSQLGEIHSRDRKAERYLARRYDPVFPVETKLLLLMLEGEANVGALLLSATASHHEEAVFRARFVSLYHILRAVTGILDAYPDASSDKTKAVRGLLEEPTLKWFRSDQGVRKLRNRCVHYLILDPDLPLHVGTPMWGMVETLCPGRSFDEMNQYLAGALARVSRALAEWGHERGPLWGVGGLVRAPRWRIGSLVATGN